PSPRAATPSCPTAWASVAGEDGQDGQPLFPPRVRRQRRPPLRGGRRRALRANVGRLCEAALCPPRRRGGLQWPPLGCQVWGVVGSPIRGAGRPPPGTASNPSRTRRPPGCVRGGAPGGESPRGGPRAPVRMLPGSPFPADPVPHEAPMSRRFAFWLAASALALLPLGWTAPPPASQPKKSVAS